MQTKCRTYYEYGLSNTARREVAVIAALLTLPATWFLNIQFLAVLG